VRTRDEINPDQWQIGQAAGSNAKSMVQPMGQAHGSVAESNRQPAV
jgi:hypothetical protein